MPVECVSIAQVFPFTRFALVVVFFFFFSSYTSFFGFIIKASKGFPIE